MRTRLVVVALLALVGSLAPFRPAAAAAPASFVFPGAGWGHGVGMSQWGAYGQALEGRTHDQILGHYYAGTELSPVDDAVDIRVSLISDTARAQARGEGGPLNVWLDGATHVALEQQVVEVTVGDGKVAVSIGGTPVGSAALVRLMPTSLVAVVGPTEGFDFSRPGHRYRYGLVDVQVSGGDLEVVNQLRMPEYLRGVAEVPSSWPEEVLKAQAVAARTYAHRARAAAPNTDLVPCRCHVFDTVRSQVFAGYVKETGPSGARWVDAVESTTGRVLKHQGRLATTLYFSSSGGRTQNTWDRFGGSQAEFPYLASVDDRWSLAPYNRNAAWSHVRDQAQVAAAFGLSTRDVVRIDIEPTEGGAVKTATATTAGGATARISGGTLAEKLQLTSRWVGVPAVRVAGADRYATSVALGRQAAPIASTVVIASGEQGHLVDGLVAGPLAQARTAPILLTTRDALPPPVAEELDSRKPSVALIVGGKAAVGDGVERALLLRGIKVTRYAGADRYATAAEVARALAGRRTAVVASGATANLVDALAAGPAAGAAGHPILLTDPSALPAATKQALDDGGITATVVVGGKQAVSEQVEKQLPAPTRVAGGDRFATSVAVATHYAALIRRDDQPTRVAVASGGDGNLVDALPAGALRTLLVLTGTDQLPAGTGAWLRARSDEWRLGAPAPVVRVDVLGGRAAVGDAAFDDVRGALYP